MDGGTNRWWREREVVRIVGSARCSHHLNFDLDMPRYFKVDITVEFARVKVVLQTWSNLTDGDKLLQ